MLLLLRQIILWTLVRPFALLVLGFEARGRVHLPKTGPAIVAANHNSHLDTLLLISLFPAAALSRLRPAAAADTFTATPLVSWFSRRIIGVLPVDRGRPERGTDPLAGCREALARKEILIIFPEGTRGDPEELGRFKSGIARLAEAEPDAPIVPVYLQGAGRVLPRGSMLLVPFNCFAVIGAPIRFAGKRPEFMARLKDAIEALRADAPPLRWL